jgi:glycosyltransferase involved in cell wall biosynthesis
MRLGYLSFYDASDVFHWSGLVYNINKALELAGAEVIRLDNRNFDIPLIKLLEKSIRLKTRSQKFIPELDLRVLKRNSKSILKNIPEGLDAILSPGTRLLYFLDTQLPIYFYTDATFQGINDYYEKYSNLTKTMKNNGHLIDKEVIDKSRMAFYSSEWAAKSAIETYCANPDKVRVVPFGANIEHEYSKTEIDRFVSSRITISECNLLFVGVEWYRKGGDIALNVARALNESGLNTKLHVVGLSNIPEKNLPAYVVNHGFLRKQEPSEKEMLDNLYKSADFLVVPSRNEAYGLVYPEANSYGVPAIGSDTGGVPTIIKTGVNGMIAPLHSPVQDIVNFISHYKKNPGEYRKLALSSFHAYKKTYNWAVAGKTIVDCIQESLVSPR